ncbi:MAG: hypothetical protein WC253_02085 [Sulfurovaceae bacterium]|nr:hypothetical protein [Sulfurovaceae bacterium]
MKKLSIKYLVAAGLLSTTFSFAEVSVNLGVNVGVGAVTPGFIAGVFEMDRHYNEPVYFYKGRYYYGGDYRNGYYFYNGMRLVGGEFYRKPRFYHRDEPRIIVHPRNYVVFVEDRYYDRPSYFYKGKYYYGGHFKNGYYFHNGRRLHGGKFFTHPRKIQQKHYAKREDVKIYKNEDRRDRDFRRDDRDDRRDRDFRRDDRDDRRDRDYR